MKEPRLKSGMTLIEVLVVMAVLSIGLIPIIGLYTGQSKQASQSVYLLNAHTHLLCLLQQTESELHSCRFDIEEMGSVRSRMITTSWGHVDKAKVLVQETVSLSPSELREGLIIIEAKVSWKESRGNVVANCHHELTHLLCSPRVGQEALQ